MAANAEDPGMPYVPMEDPNMAAAAPDRRSKLIVTLGGICCLAAIAAVSMHASLADPEALKLIELPHIPRQQPTAEDTLLPSKLVGISTVWEFNELLSSSIVANHQSLYDTMQPSQLAALHDDFLRTIGSQAPETPGKVPSPRKRYSTQHEHDRRLDQFKKNLLDILRQNDEAYARDHGADRIRFGITVHADWEEEEFLNNRLNLKATNMTAHLAALKLKLNQPNAAKPSPPKPVFAANHSFSAAAPRNLAAVDGCEIVTGGTCRILPCHSRRGAECYEGQCVCIDGACAENGICKRPGGCQVSTGGTCRIFGCAKSRNAQCVEGDCVCAPGLCSVDGKCVPTWMPEPAGEVSCSRILNGPVRNQGSCGDCWAFSTAQQLRYMSFRKYGSDPGEMSVQYMVDCFPDNMNTKCDEGVKGCCGGLPIRADAWLEQNGGLPTTAEYGPEVSDGSPATPFECKSDVQKAVTPDSMAYVYHSELDLANGFCERGPVAIAINANSKLQHYIGGVFSEAECPALSINHAVLYVGVDKYYDGGKPVHVVLNSWGPSWGVRTRGGRPYKHTFGEANGHVLFKYEENTCNVMALPTQPVDVTWEG